MNKQYDVAVIGAGNAGFAVAKQTHAAGLSTAMVESAEFGGTCPNRGCTPKKVLVAAARAIDEIEKAHHHAICTDRPRLDWAALIDRERALIDHIPSAMEQAAKGRATVYRGQARFTGANELQVEGEHLSARHIVIATGSTPRELDLSGAKFMATSDDLLRNRDLPGHVLFVGGGVIALEFGHVLVRAGVRVTILETLPRLLPRMDAEAVDVLRKHSEGLGIRVITDAQVERIAQTGTAYRVDYRHQGESQSIESELVVNGAGRVPNVASLDLEAANIARDGLAIEVDAFQRSTSNPAIWIAGDALTTTAQLSPLATLEGDRVGSYIVNGLPEEARPALAPQAVFTIPALASVGLTEAQALQSYPEVKIHTSNMTDWFSAKTHVEPVAWAKVLIDTASDAIVGAHLLGHGGEELIHLFTLAMNHGISATDLRRTTFAFPTYSSDIRNMF